MTEFFTADATKRILKINDSVDDPIINDFAVDANIDLENYIRTFYSDVPIADNQITSDMTSAVNFDVAMMYLLRIRNYDGVEQFKKLRDEKRLAIKNSFLNNITKNSTYAYVF